MPASRAVLFDIDSTHLSHKSSHTRSALVAARRGKDTKALPVDHDESQAEPPRKKRTVRKQQPAT